VTPRTGIGLPPDRLAALFPFHLAIDRELRIVQAGPSLVRVYPAAAPGGSFDAVFRVARPPVEGGFAALRAAAGELMVLEARDGPLVLRGELVSLDADSRLLFLGQPWLTDLAALGALGLSLSDFPPHSPLIELLHLLQAQNVAVGEMRELNEKRKRQQSDLRRTQRRLEEELAESERAEALARSILDTAVDGILTIDERGVIQTVNAASERLFGYAAEEVVGRNVSLLMPEPDRSAHDGYLRRYLETGKRRVIGRGREVEGLHRDGTRFPLYLSVGEMRVGGERRFTGIVQDITERKRSEEELRVSEARTRALVENLMEGLLVLRPDFAIEDLNPAAERIFGYRREDLVGQSVVLLLPDEPEYRAEEFLDRAREQALNRTRSGEVFPIEVQLYEVETPAGRLLAAHVRDLSERHEVDRLKKQFVSAVSHELRTPLTSLRGSLGLLAAGAVGELPAAAEEVVAIAERNTTRLVTLINDILDLERLEAGQLALERRPTPVRGVLEEARETVEALAGQQGVSIQLPDAEGLILGDHDRLVQVVVNLLSNAIKFTPEGSRVRVEARRDGESVRLAVSDEGRGVPPGFREQIFEPFRQVEGSDARKKGGTGLGLAICRSIVEQHDGTIGVEAREGPGATFWFTVPAADAAVTDEVETTP
jgi:PAS domain S-box-containing protein